MRRVQSVAGSRDLPKGEIKNLRHVLKYLSPHKPKLFLVFIALFASSSAVLSIGAGLRYLIDKGFSANDASTLDSALLFLFGIIIVLSAATYGRFYLITEIGERVVASIRRDIYNHLISLSPSFFETAKTGELISRITTDTTVLQVVIGSSLSSALRNILIFIGGLTLLIITSAKLAGYIAIMIPVVVLPVLILGKKVRGLSRISQEKVGDIASHIEETFYGIKTVQACAREKMESENFSLRIDNAFEAAMKRVKMRSFLTAIVIFVSFSLIGLVLWFGGQDVIAGKITAGELSSFMFYSVLVASSFGAISEVIGDIQRAAGSAEGLMEVLNIKTDIKEIENPEQFPSNIEGRIKIDSVSFYYNSNPDKPAISDITFEAKSGEMVALVGPSGAGKSTVVQLLLRFYDPQKGRIFIDDVDISHLSLHDLRSQFAYVPQDPVIFSASAKDNIAYARPDASDEEIIEAAKIASAFDFIENLPNGFDSFLGEKGVRLSGGEKQRIAIARAALKNPRILLLDEATSALDAQNEQLVQNALERLMKNRTTIVIAHRLATIQNADKIIVITDGKIESIGTHEELLKEGNLYKRLAKLQFTG